MDLLVRELAQPKTTGRIVRDSQSVKMTRNNSKSPSMEQNRRFIHLFLLMWHREIILHNCSVDTYFYDTFIFYIN